MCDFLKYLTILQLYHAYDKPMVLSVGNLFWRFVVEKCNLSAGQYFSEQISSDSTNGSKDA